MTNSLIHLWESDGMLTFSKSDEETNSSISWMDLRVSTFPANCSFWINNDFNHSLRLLYINIFIEIYVFLLILGWNMTRACFHDRCFFRCVNSWSECLCLVSLCLHTHTHTHTHTCSHTAEFLHAHKTNRDHQSDIKDELQSSFRSVMNCS